MYKGENVIILICARLFIKKYITCYDYEKCIKCGIILYALFIKMKKNRVLCHKPTFLGSTVKKAAVD